MARRKKGRSGGRKGYSSRVRKLLEYHFDMVPNLAKRARLGVGETQEGFARLLGVTRMTVINWEKRGNWSRGIRTLLECIERAPLSMLEILDGAGDGRAEIAEKKEVTERVPEVTDTAEVAEWGGAGAPPAASARRSGGAGMGYDRGVDLDYGFFGPDEEAADVSGDDMRRGDVVLGVGMSDGGLEGAGGADDDGEDVVILDPPPEPPHKWRWRNPGD